MLIGGDKFEKTCSLLVDGAKSLPAGPEWQDVDPDDLVDYVKTLSLFLTLFSPEYLSTGTMYIEKYPAYVFRKGVEIVIDIAIGDKLPKSLPVLRQEEVESFVLEQLLIINNFEWPEDHAVKDRPAADLLLPLTHAALGARNRHAASLFITLSTLALGITRRMSVQEFCNNRDHLISLLNGMAAFILDSLSKEKEAPSVKAAVSSWMSVLFEGYAHSKTGEGKAIQKWDVEDQR
ncbi:hypothetical protein BDZ89DRAFT_393797 [Hymenopellis radicata]|nr:hypothetical protein BDZ89DRAFT_393797 [Hymenopellis radicata]